MSIQPVNKAVDRGTGQVLIGGLDRAGTNRGTGIDRGTGQGMYC